MSRDSGRCGQLRQLGEGIGIGSERGEVGRHSEREGSVWQAKRGIQGYTAILSWFRHISSNQGIAREDTFQEVDEAQKYRIQSRCYSDTLSNGQPC